MRERIEGMLRPNGDGLMPCPWCLRPAERDTFRREDYESITVRCSSFVGECDFPAVTRDSDQDFDSEKYAEPEDELTDLWNQHPYRLLARALLLAIEQRDKAFANLSRQIPGVSDAMSDHATTGAIKASDHLILAILDGKEPT